MIPRTLRGWLEQLAVAVGMVVFVVALVYWLKV
jgi:hypothetical protein